MSNDRKRRREDKITSRTYPNGVVTTYEYDNMDRLKLLRDVGGGNTATGQGKS